MTFSELAVHNYVYGSVFVRMFEFECVSEALENFLEYFYSFGGWNWVMGWWGGPSIMKTLPNFRHLSWDYWFMYVRVLNIESGQSSAGRDRKEVSKMRRQQTRYRSDSIASPSGGRKPSISVATPPSPFSSGSPTRRESLVKPTWQHITPGQLPPKTLDKINGIASDDSDDDGYPKRRPSVIVHQRQQSISQQPLLPEYMSASSLFRSAPDPAPQTSTQQPQTAGNGFMARLNSVRLAAGTELQPLLDTGGGGGGPAGQTAMAAPAPGPGAEGASATLCKNAGRALIRMISSTNAPEDDEDFDIMGKVNKPDDPSIRQRKSCFRLRLNHGIIQKLLNNFHRKL